MAACNQLPGGECILQSGETSAERGLCVGRLGIQLMRGVNIRSTNKWTDVLFRNQAQASLDRWFHESLATWGTFVRSLHKD